ncbi:uncharacterized protein LOC132700321 [Cylas formicarius]|uniref:uncharacterized protein LOC132700321 n=1 Tax=Cylas formicarius TaxID=197179 RepID=UPI00295869F0|nr:uncharacterized protein LOC132700321 [Cylas formicarius]
MKIYMLLVSLVAIVKGQQQKNYQYTTPVPILKQIDKHNDDGSYSYGYEAADGTYKIETKYQTGEVYGKYGYIDDTGALREVEYGASKHGFAPSGPEIQVPPPTINENPDAQRPLGPNEEDDGQYREDPSVYYKNDPNYEPPPPVQYHTTFSGFPQQSYQSNYQAPQSYQPQPSYQPAYTPPAQPQPSYNNYYNRYNPSPPTPQYNYAPQRNNYWNAPNPYPNYNQFQGHPASNVDIWTGSYTVNYR